MVRAKKWIKATEFVGEPKDSNFRVEEEEVPAPKDGEFVCEALYISVDPYMRALPYPVGTTAIGEQVAKVTESKTKDYPVGCFVQLYCGWRTRTLVNPKTAPADLRLTRLVDMGKLSPSLALGVVGMPGVTAYFAFLEKCLPKEGETVVVNAAAGAVGSLVGQLAKIKKCRVIGFAGTKEKCSWAKSLGFDEVFNYKQVDVSEAIKKSAPKGVDIFFDNVGGVFASKVLAHMNEYGRVLLCGGISVYSASEQPQLPFPFFTILIKRLSVNGFLIFDHFSRWSEGKVAMLKWINEGKVKYQETVRQGFDGVPKAFMEQLKGGNIGKMVVKI